MAPAAWTWCETLPTVADMPTIIAANVEYFILLSFLVKFRR
ncbi:hypothetical protein yinte0001_18980 [Yersinia intermedia ATCC 29909]|nr:hypothetical protein yinte0001_18980 [Yersinia intermedia ATCC 29909]